MSKSRISFSSRIVMTVILDFSAKNKFEVMTVFEKNQLHNAGHLKTL